MKVRWLNADLTEAEVTTGFWRWLRVAVLHRICATCWEHKSTGRRALSNKLEHARDRAIAREAERAEWVKPAKVPRAQLLKGG